MAVSTDNETVVIHRGATPREPSEITINCPDKAGLGCDVTRIIFEFGLSLVKGDLSTDGRWCFFVFWVIPRPPPRVLSHPSPSATPLPMPVRSIKWSLLRQRLLTVCPSSDPVFPLPLASSQSSSRLLLPLPSTMTVPAQVNGDLPSLTGPTAATPTIAPAISGLPFGSSITAAGPSVGFVSNSNSSAAANRLAASSSSHQPDVFLLQLKGPDRCGLLNDMTQLLWELELTIQKVNVSTSPGGQAIDFFFLTDNRGELPARSRVTQIIDHVCTCLPSLKPPPPLSSSPFAAPATRHAQSHLSSSRPDLLAPSDARYECTVLPTTGPGAVDLHGLGLGVSECVPYTVAKFLLADEHQPAALPAELMDGSAVQGSNRSLGFGGRGKGGFFIEGASEGMEGGRAGGGGGGGDGSGKRVNGGSMMDESVISGVSESGMSEGGVSEGVSDVAFSPVFSAGLGPTHKPLSTAKISVDNLMSPVHSMLQVYINDRKGLVYDCLRTLRDLSLRVAYGRITTNADDSTCQLDVFIQDRRGFKVESPAVQAAICERLREELQRPLRIVVVTRGGKAAARPISAGSCGSTASNTSCDTVGSVGGVSSRSSSSNGSSSGSVVGSFGSGSSSSSSNASAHSLASEPQQRSEGQPVGSAGRDQKLPGTATSSSSINRQQQERATKAAAVASSGWPGTDWASLLLAGLLGSSSSSQSKSNGRERKGGSEGEEERDSGCVVDEGAEAELLVAAPLEKRGRGRPRVLYDVTLVLRQLDIQVFKADISRHEAGGKGWEVYRLILQDRSGQPIMKLKTRLYIADQVRNVLMG